MKKVLALVLITALFFTIVGCQKSAINGSMISTKVILDYLPNTNHTGLYVALEKGYYKDVGLDVEIIEQTEGATATLIATGKGDFGISYQEDVTNALSSEEPLPIKTIATIIQHNTSGFASYKGKNIKTVQDFAGKIYAGWGSPAEEAVLNAVMTKFGVSPASIKIITSDDSGMATLIDKVDLKWIFWAWDGIGAKLQGIELNYIELRDLDSRLDYYTPVLITNKKLIEENPEKISKFMKATKKGYEFAIANPLAAAEILHKYAPDYDLEFLKESQEYLSQKYSEDSEKWGIMQSSVWNNYTEFMLEQGLISHSIVAEDCYTNEFIQ
ncbi:MAG: ABC transporter substrate-binding protein [Clostridia bacterium]